MIKERNTENKMLCSSCLRSEHFVKIRPVDVGIGMIMKTGNLFVRKFERIESSDCKFERRYDGLDLNGGEQKA